MKMKFMKNIIGLTLISISMTFANSITDLVEKDTKAYKTLCYTSDCMSTIQLQKEVEKLSREGQLPFDMGLELMKRWSENKVS